MGWASDGPNCEHDQYFPRGTPGEIPPYGVPAPLDWTLPHGGDEGMACRSGPGVKDRVDSGGRPSLRRFYEKPCARFCCNCRTEKGGSRLPEVSYGWRDQGPFMDVGAINFSAALSGLVEWMVWHNRVHKGWLLPLIFISFLALVAVLFLAIYLDVPPISNWFDGGCEEINATQLQF